MTLVSVNIDSLTSWADRSVENDPIWCRDCGRATVKMNKCERAPTKKLAITRLKCARGGHRLAGHKILEQRSANLESGKILKAQKSVLERK